MAPARLRWALPTTLLPDGDQVLGITVRESREKGDEPVSSHAGSSSGTPGPDFQPRVADRRGNGRVNAR